MQATTESMVNNWPKKVRIIRESNLRNWPMCVQIAAAAAAARSLAVIKCHS